ncbi:MAG: hypothetical protein GX621_02540, partial [Pirellulaceae bacterium]|nr:hypothetical protein [Pirellulaceae bacterium]
MASNTTEFMPKGRAMKVWIWLLVALVFVPVLGLFVAILVASRDIAPPNTADLVPEPFEVADEENAYSYFAAAVAAVDWQSEDDDLLFAVVNGEKPDPEHRADFLSRNREAFALMEKGLACRALKSPEANASNDDEDGMPVCGLPIDMFILKFQQHLEDGEIEEAAKTCGQMLRLG